jgi:uncharacterized protein YecT (DUF1311 family)
MAMALMGSTAPASWSVRPAETTSNWMAVLGGYDWDGSAAAEAHRQERDMSPDQDVDLSSDSALNKATNDQLAANRAMSAVWDQISPDAKAKILPDQKAWIVHEASDCNRQADAAVNPAASHTVRAECDAKATLTRVDWLKQYLPAGH